MILDVIVLKQAQSEQVNSFEQFSLHASSCMILMRVFLIIAPPVIAA